MDRPVPMLEDFLGHQTFVHALRGNTVLDESLPTPLPRAVLRLPSSKVRRAVLSTLGPWRSIASKSSSMSLVGKWQLQLHMDTLSSPTRNFLKFQGILLQHTGDQVMNSGLVRSPVASP